MNGPRPGVAGRERGVPVTTVPAPCLIRLAAWRQCEPERRRCSQERYTQALVVVSRADSFSLDMFVTGHWPFSLQALGYGQVAVCQQRYLQLNPARRSKSGRHGLGARNLRANGENKDGKAGGKGGGLFGGLGNLMDAMKKAQEFSKSAQQLQEELKNTEIEATSSDGRVRAVVSGQQVPIRVEVADDLLAEGNPAVSEAVTEAVRNAHLKSAEVMRQQLADLTQSYGLPQPPKQ